MLDHMLVMLAALLAAAPATKAIDEAPAGVSVSGKILAGVSYRDALGDNVVLVTRTPVSERHTEEDTLAEQYLYGYHFVKEGDGSWRELWKTIDFVADCFFDLVVEYFPGSLAVTDLDGDGTAETRFAYELNCSSDVTPNTLKLLMHEGRAKYAVRGTIRVPSGVNEKGERIFSGGEMKLDAALVAIPAFAKDATKRFVALQKR